MISSTFSRMWMEARFGLWSLLLMFSPEVLGREHLFKCPTQSGTFAHLTSCRLYWICQSELHTLATCDFGLMYNHRTKKCDLSNAEICSLVDGNAVRNWKSPFPTVVTSLKGTLFKDGEKKTKTETEDENEIGLNDTEDFSGKESAEPPIKVKDVLPSGYDLMMSKWRHFQKLWTARNGHPSKQIKENRRPFLTEKPTNVASQTSTASMTATTLRLRPTRKPSGIAVDQNCNKSNCQLPYCYCDAFNIPNGLPPNKTPQMVMVTWDDSVNGGNFDFIKRVFAKTRTNPNGCPITGTFFVSHQWTDYKMVQKLYERGHEIASHSLSHMDCTKCTESMWKNEIVGEALAAHVNAHVNRSDIVGMRAPFLGVGGDAMFQMLWSNGFLYDSSIPSSQTDPPLWPYTLDNPVPHSCYVSCPKKRYPGLWEVPMTSIMGLRNIGCSMYDACVMPEDPEELTEIMWDNFMKHYNTNRAPYLLSAHAAWFWSKWNRQQALYELMDRALELGDVWFVSVHQALNWMQQPTVLADLAKFVPWQCARPKT